MDMVNMLKREQPLRDNKCQHKARHCFNSKFRDVTNHFPPFYNQVWAS